MLVTLSEIAILLKEEQPSNAPSPILVTLLGTEMLIKELQSLKAYFSILITPFGMINDFAS